MIIANFCFYENDDKMMIKCFWMPQVHKAGRHFGGVRKGCYEDVMIHNL